MRKFDVKVKRRSRPPRIDPGLLAALKLLDKIPLAVWAIVAVVVAGMVWGTPHVLVTYHCYGSCHSPRANVFACDYLGIQGWRAGLLPVDGGCRIVRLL